MAVSHSTGLIAFVGLALVAITLPTAILAQSVGGSPPIVVQIVPGSEVTANTPAEFPVVPDEHSSIVPLPGSGNEFLVFTGEINAGGLVMTTSDFHTFADASGAGYSSPSLAPLEPRPSGVCTPAVDSLFDDNYAAPGSVFPDPAAPGTWLMIYEAENHCRNNVIVQPFYVSAGVARSLNQGKTWPAPAFASPGYDSFTRYAGATSQYAKPTDDVTPVGDAIPSGLVSDGYVYMFFTDYRLGAPRQIEAARAHDTGRDPMMFYKFSQTTGWTIPASTRDGLATAAGSQLVTFPSGFECGEVGVQAVDLHGDGSGVPGVGKLFVIIMECDTRFTVGGDQRPQGGWFYATTRSLQTEAWSNMALVAGTLQYIDCGTGKFDGYYPSFVTPALPPGHIGTTGHALYLSGILTAHRVLNVRDFQISTGTPAAFSPLPTISCSAVVSGALAPKLRLRPH
jgi:hypothetical protein